MREPGPSRPKRPVIIGVAGGSGAGKTTISQAIVQYVGRERITYIQHDSYYRDLSHLSLEDRRRENFDHPDALEDSLLLQHLNQLIAGQPAEVPVYDFSTYVRRAVTIHVEPRPVIILEGILIFVNPTLRQLMDIKIYVDADADIRFIRRLERDVHERGRSLRSVIDQYLETVRPMHLEFVEPSKRYADLIIPEGGYNAVALDVLRAHIERLLVQDVAEIGKGSGPRE